MEFGWNEELEAFREEVRVFLLEFDTPALREELANRGEAAQLAPSSRACAKRWRTAAGFACAGPRSSAARASPSGSSSS